MSTGASKNRQERVADQQSSPKKPAWQWKPASFNSSTNISPNSHKRGKQGNGS